MQEKNLTVTKRSLTGKGPNRRLRSEGDIPAIIYGPTTDPISIKVNYVELYRLMHGEPLSTIINISIDGDDAPARKVIIRELQKDPVSNQLMHIDFHHIRLDRPITLTVQFSAVGLPIGVKDFGGVVQHIRRDIDISCLPTNIPGLIEIDISELNVGDSIHVSDLDLNDVEILTPADSTLITVVAPTVVKEATTDEEEGEEGVEGVEGEEGAEGAEGADGEAKPEEGGDDKKKDDGKK